MQLAIIPCDAQGAKKLMTENLIYRHRTGEPPVLFMRNMDYNVNETKKSYSFMGEFAEGMSFDSLQEGDRLFLLLQRTWLSNIPPLLVDLYSVDELMLPFSCEPTALSIAANLETHPKVYLGTKKSYAQLTRAQSIVEKAEELYAEAPGYRTIMLRHGDTMESVDLITFATRQDEETQAEIEALFLAMSKVFHTTATLGERILKKCKFEDGFSFLSEAEQVGAFIEFSKQVSGAKTERVPDELIESIRASEAYAKVLETMEERELKVSKTQQFNVLQSVGLFSKNFMDNVVYNLSDMGAGKTLMTVESIYLLDLAQMKHWEHVKESQVDEERMQKVVDVCLPDKHLIAPTLSIKSSWLDTFRLFYEVTEAEDHWVLTLTWKNMTMTSRLYAAPFTVKDKKIFVKQALPYARNNTYLIIDEMHQLVVRSISRTKFFPRETVPVDHYKIFVLSGTMSNMLTAQWFYLVRFLGLHDLILDKPQDARKQEEETLAEYRQQIVNTAANLKVNQHRYFDTDLMTEQNTYLHKRTKKQTGPEAAFFTRYGSQVINPFRTDQTSVESTFVNGRFTFETDPAELDNINFELFYQTVGSKAITAESLVVAEELFGAQQRQHASDIIKTVSPLSPSDIRLLKILHHIASDYNQYKSSAIAKAINCAILNLNDGLQTKNVYEIISGYADRNLRFLEYLSGLDVNILEELPKSGLIELPVLEETDKFKVLQDILQREKEDAHLIVVNDYAAMRALANALDIRCFTKKELAAELEYQELIDNLFEEQSVVIVTQDMIKSSLDLIKANRLIQYQLNTEISDIIQTQNRINRIGQTRETKCYYIVSDQLQESLVELFLESYRNIRVAHRGIVELFVDITSQVNVINDYLDRAFRNLESEEEPELVEEANSDLVKEQELPEGKTLILDGDTCRVILYPNDGTVQVLAPLTDGSAFCLGELRNPPLLQAPITSSFNVRTRKLASPA